MDRILWVVICWQTALSPSGGFNHQSRKGKQFPLIPSLTVSCATLQTVLEALPQRWEEERGLQRKTELPNMAFLPSCWQKHLLELTAFQSKGTPTRSRPAVSSVNVIYLHTSGLSFRLSVQKLNSRYSSCLASAGGALENCHYAESLLVNRTLSEC